jgi:hypothetical protein
MHFLQFSNDFYNFAIGLVGKPRPRNMLNSFTIPLQVKEQIISIGIVLIGGRRPYLMMVYDELKCIVNVCAFLVTKNNKYEKIFIMSRACCFICIMQQIARR